MNEQFWEFLAKYWADRINPEEKAEMERLLLEHPDHWLKTGLMQQISWKPDQMLSFKQTERISDRVLGSKPAPASTARGRKRSSAAYWRAGIIATAILFIATLLLVLARHHPQGRTVLWHRITTANGMKTTLRLADGSELWLNAGSMLRYPETFGDGTREVYLRGEAYFKIAHQAGKPFMIHTEDMDVKAMGTELDVRAYQEDPYSETTLIQGYAEVGVNGGKQVHQIFLKPKEKIIVAKSTGDAVGGADSLDGVLHKLLYGAGTGAKDVVLEPVHMVTGGLSAETAWKQDILMFTNEPFDGLARKIERWYGVKVVIRNTALAGQRFTGRADDLPLENLLEMLQTTKPFIYKIKDNQLIIE